MYKHNAKSIKETNEKMFISSSERAVYNSKADPDHNHNDTYYTKESINNRLNKTFITKKDRVVNGSSVSGFIDELQIIGDSRHRIENLKVDVPMEYGAISSENGENVIIYNDDGTEREIYRSIDFISVEVGDHISFIIGDMNIIFYDINKEYIGYAYTENYTIPLFSDIKYIKFYGGTKSKDNVILNIKRTHYTDIKSVGRKISDDLYEFDIVSCGVNMARPEVLNNWNYERPTKISDTIYASPAYNIKPSTQYCFSVKTIVDGGLSLLWLDDDYNFISRGDSKINQTAIISTAPPNATKVQLYVYEQGVTCDRTTYMKDNEWLLTETSDDEVVQYSIYEESIKTIQLPIQLEGIVEDKVHMMEDRDVLYIGNDNKLFIQKKIGTIDFSKEGIQHDIVEYKIKEYEKYPNLVGWYLKGFNTNGNYVPDAYNCIVNKPLKIQPGAYYSTYQSIGINKDGNLYVILDKNVAGSTEAFKEYMKTVIFKCPLKTPETIEIGPIENFTVKTFNNVTNISVQNTDTNGFIQCKLPVNMGGSISSATNTLNALKKELNDIQKMVKSNNMTIDSSNGVCDIIESKSGSYIDDIIIEGTTLKCLYTIKDINQLQSSGYSAGVVKQFDPVNNIARWSKETATGQTPYPRIVLDPLSKGVLEPGKTYTVSYTIRSNNPIHYGYAISNGDAYYGLNINNEWCITSKSNLGSGKGTTIVDTFVAKAPSNPTNSLNIGFSPLYEANNTFPQWFEIENFMILEGDHADKLVGYFTGLQSSCDNTIKLLSYKKDSNLFDKITHIPDTAITWAQGVNSTEVGSVASDFIPVSAGMNIVSNKKCQFMYYDTNKKYVGHGMMNGINDSCKSVVIPNNIRYLRVSARIVNNGNIPVNPDELIVSIDKLGELEHREYVQEINLTEPLRGLPNGVKDTIEKINGKYCIVRRCGYKLLNGTETWGTANESMCINGYLGFFSSLPGRKGSTRLNLISDKFKTNFNLLNGVFNEESIFGESIETKPERFYITISSSKLTDNTVNSFKQWLTSNNVSVVYELENPIITPLNQDISIPTFDKSTILHILSGSVTANISASVTTKLANTVNVLINKIEELEEFDNVNNRIKLRSLYESNRTRFNIDIITTISSTQCDIDEDLYKLFLDVINLGVDNYNRTNIEEQIDFYTLIGKFNFEMSNTLYNIIEIQYLEIIEVGNNE